jgi:hypothetical protein
MVLAVGKYVGELRLILVRGSLGLGYAYPVSLNMVNPQQPPQG